MKNFIKNTILCFYFIFATLVFAEESENKKPESPFLMSSMTNAEVRELFQNEKYAEAESVYLKTANPNPFWLALLKLKQGNFDSAIKLLKEEIAKQKMKEDKIIIIEKSCHIIADVSFEKAMSFIKDYEQDISTSLNITCFKARFYLQNNDINKAEKIIKNILKQVSSISDHDIRNVENVMYSFISHLYVKEMTKEALEFFDLAAKQYPKIRMDPGAQLLWASIAAHENKGFEALKKVDWVIETFPDYCKQNEHMVLITKASCFESVGDKMEAKKILEQLDGLVKQNFKYAGIKGMVEGKLKQYHQEEESKKRMEAVAEEAQKNPYGFSEEELKSFSQNNYWSVPRMVLCLSGIILIVFVVFRVIRKKK
jgi:tetratricopeptide (TPR) repeat protein